MTKEGLKNYIESYFVSHDLVISQGGILVLVSPDHLREDQLNTVDDDQLLKNMDLILNQIMDIHENHLEKEFRRKKRWWRSNYLINKSLRKEEITDTRVMTILSRYLGELPPYK